MFWMMNGRNRRSGGIFLLPGILFGSLFCIWAVAAVLNVAGVVIGAVISALAAAFSGVAYGIGAAFDAVFSGAEGYIGLPVGIALGLALVACIRRQKAKSADDD